MAIIRLPAPTASDYVRAAQDDDPSVAGGLPQVAVDVRGQDDQLTPAYFVGVGVGLRGGAGLPVEFSALS
jgi:hypothetical protein